MWAFFFCRACCYLLRFFVFCLFFSSGWEKVSQMSGFSQPMVRRGIFVSLSRCAFSLLWGARSARVRLLAAVFFDVLGLNSQLLEDFSIWCVRFVPETSYHLSNEGFRWMPELTGWENLSVGESYKGVGPHFFWMVLTTKFLFCGGGVGVGLMGVILISFLSAQRWVFPQLYLKGINRSGFVLDYDHFVWVRFTAEVELEQKIRICFGPSLVGGHQRRQTQSVWLVALPGLLPLLPPNLLFVYFLFWLLSICWGRYGRLYSLIHHQFAMCWERFSVSSKDGTEGFPRGCC